MTSMTRTILTDDKAASLGFISILGMLCFQPRKFFRLMHRIPIKHGVVMAILIIALLSYSAILQANLSMPSVGEEEYLPDDEFRGMDVLSSGDPSQSWMTGFSVVGKQAIYWLVLMIVLSEVSLFKGKAPDLGRNLQIAVWSSFPLAMMATLQILFLMGGGLISAVGFTGFLDTWQSYYELHPYLQSAVYALAAQLTFFSLWNLVLLYKGARESLRGNRIVVAIVLLSWLVMLTAALGFEHYQLATAEPADDFYYDEIMPEEEMQLNDSFLTDPPNETNFEDYP
jgi:hypothetical protein